MQPCISVPCFSFLPHQCSPYAPPSISVGESQHSSSLEMCAGAKTALGPRNHPEAPHSCCPRDAWTRPGMDFMPSLCWEKVAVCATWKHGWSFPCATTGSSLRPAPGTDCSSWDYFHTFPTKTAFLLHELLFSPVPWSRECLLVGFDQITKVLCSLLQPNQVFLKIVRNTLRVFTRS